MTKYLLNLVCIVGMAGAAHAGAVANLEITADGHAYLVFADGGIGEMTGYEILDGAGTPTLTFARVAPEDGTGQYATGWAPLMSQGIPTGVVSGTLPTPDNWFVEGDSVINAFIGEVVIEGQLAAAPGTPVYIGRILNTDLMGGNLATVDFTSGRLANLQFNVADSDEAIDVGAVSLRTAAALQNGNDSIAGATWKETGVVGAAGTDFDAVYVENPDGTGTVAVLDLKVVSSATVADTTTSQLAGTVMVDGNIQTVTYADLVETVIAGDITASVLRVKTIGADGVISINSTPTQTGSDSLGHFGTLASNMVVSLVEGDFGGAPLNTPNGTSDAADIDQMFAAITAVSTDILFDVNADGAVDAADKDVLVLSLVGTPTSAINANGTQYGDSNLDGAVGGADFSILAFNYGAAGGWAVGDYNGDAQVGGADFSILAFNYGWAQTPIGPAPLAGAAAPEPATMAILAIGGLAVIRRRRRA